VRKILKINSLIYPFIVFYREFKGSKQFKKGAKNCTLPTSEYILVAQCENNTIEIYSENLYNEFKKDFE